MNYYLDALKKYAEFKGRATKKEYWMFVLVNIIISILISLVGKILFLGHHNTLSSLYNLAVLIPGFAVAVRRLHDTGRSAHYLWLLLLPLVGPLILIFYMCKDSIGDNKYGQKPNQSGEPTPPMPPVPPAQPINPTP